MVVYAADHMTDRPQARQLLAQAIREAEQGGVH